MTPAVREAAKRLREAFPIHRHCTMCPDLHDGIRTLLATLDEEEKAPDTAIAREARLRQALARCPSIASRFTVRPDAQIHPDIPWAQMNESARTAAHTTAQQIAEELRVFVALALAGGGEEKK